MDDKKITKENLARMPHEDLAALVLNLSSIVQAQQEEIANLKNIVFKGPFRDKGMPDFTGRLTEADVVKIQAFIQGTADAIRPKK